METRQVIELPEGLQFISNSQDVQAVFEYLGRPSLFETYPALFVEVVNGDYIQIWGIMGIIPWLDRTAWKIL